MSKWYNPDHRRYGRYFVTADADEIAHAKSLLDTEMSECTSCQSGTPVRHTWSGTRHDGRFATFHCRSWSRWYNPDTRKWEGRAHCTCDSCF